MPPTPDRTMPWQPTAALLRSVAVAVVLITIALIWRRPDLLVVATPFALVTAWSMLTKPALPPSFDDTIGHPTLREGDATRWLGTIDAAADVDMAVAVVDHDAWIETRPSCGVTTAPGNSGRVSLDMALRSTRWGVRTIERVQVIASSPWAAFRWSTATSPRSISTLPVPGVFDVGTSPRPHDGLVGLHRSTRSGDGNEFAGLRAFRPGDRMRRINWPRSVRVGELQVNGTWADLDTHVALVVDATDDLGISEGIDGRASSLDVTVRAAGAIAEHYATRGERVSLSTFGGRIGQNVAPASGRAQLRRMLDRMARIQPGGAAGAGRHAVRQTTGSKMTVLLSPLISPEVLDQAVSLGRHGLSVVVIDTLPEHVIEHDDDLTALAWRIRLLERRREIRMVGAAGIPVVRWRGPGSLDQVIRDIARRTTGPRMVRR
jgi:uncharacterized protein (DUF58 family)